MFLFNLLKLAPGTTGGLQNKTSVIQCQENHSLSLSSVEILDPLYDISPESKRIKYVKFTVPHGLYYESLIAVSIMHHGAYIALLCCHIIW